MRGCRMTKSEVRELWARRQRGETLRSIGVALGRDHAVIHWVVRSRGGVAPPLRRRAGRTVSRPEREEISRGVAAGHTFAAIAARLGRPTSTVSREVGRHGGRRAYRADRADRRAWRRARRPKACRLAQQPRLRAAVAARLAEEWSPEQIAGWLRAAFPDNPEMQVSHETIYLSLFVQSRGVLKRALLKQLSRRRSVR